MIQFFCEDVSFDDDFFLKNVPPWLEQTARHCSSAISSLNYIFCSDQYLLRVNREYLQHDFFTDIITFDLREDSSQPIEGDVFISLDRVRSNASHLHLALREELARVIVHGLLHLLGYRDESESEKMQMRSLEDQYLKLFPSPLD